MIMPMDIYICIPTLKRGGWHRSVAYALQRGIPLILQIIANFVLLPFSPRKNAKKIQRLSYQLSFIASRNLVA